MYYITPPAEAGPMPLPPLSESVALTVRAYRSVLNIPAVGDPTEWHPALAGMVLMPGARLLLAGTDTHAPALGPECLAIANKVNFDILLVRSFGQFNQISAVFAAHPARPGRRIQFENLRFGVEPGTGASLSPQDPNEPEWLVAHYGLRPLFWNNGTSEYPDF